MTNSLSWFWGRVLRRAVCCNFWKWLQPLRDFVFYRGAVCRTVGIPAGQFDKLPTGGIAVDVPSMIRIVIDTANAVIGKARLPDFLGRPKFFLCAEGKAAFDEVKRSF